MDQDSTVTTRVAQGGRLFGIVAWLGGVAMIGSADRGWPNALVVTSGLRGRINELISVGAQTMLVLGFVVVVGEAGFIALGPRRLRIAAGLLAVLAAAAALVGLVADPRPDPELTQVGGPPLALLGVVLAAGYGILGLLRSGSEATPVPVTDYPADIATEEGTASPPMKRRRPRMSDAQLLVWTVVAIVIAVIVGFFVSIAIICSSPSEWC
jgi:hypothetical protein